MKLQERKAIKVALILLVVGAVTAFAAAQVVGFDFSKFVTSGYEPREYILSGNCIDSISVDAYDCDIRFAASDDGICRVVCPENDKITHTVEVIDGTLGIKRIDNRKWYEHIGIFLTVTSDKEIVVYLPEDTYESLRAVSVSGDIIVRGFSFTDAELSSTSGDIQCHVDVKETISVKTVSGNITLGEGSLTDVEMSSTSGDIQCDADVKETISVKTVSGDINIDGSDCREINAGSTSGNVTLEFLTASGSINISTVSGDVRLRLIDAESLDIKTVSGNVSGTLLTGKTFSTDTVSGRIDVPVSVTGGKCKIRTTSGNIKISDADSK